MSFFNKILASVGVGSATVDTRLHKAMYKPGEALTGEVSVMGGSVDQQVDDIYLDLMTQYKSDDVYLEVSLVHYRLMQKFTAKARQATTLPFSVQLPWETPITMGNFPVWVRTGLAVAGHDPKDRDGLIVEPLPVQSMLLQAMESLGLRLYKVDCEHSRKLGGQFPFVQEFEFKPWGGSYNWHVDEVELVMKGSAQGIDVLLNVDRRARFGRGMLDEVFGMDDRYSSLRFAHSDVNLGLEHFRGQLHNHISRMMV